MTFSVDVSKACEQASIDLDSVYKKALLSLFGAIVIDTPVDTGRLRGNWQYLVNGEAATSPPQATSKILSPIKDPKSVTDDANKKPVKFGDTVSMLNNMPYAETIENGHSNQAPAGMVRKNAVRWGTVVKAEIRNAGK